VEDLGSTNGTQVNGNTIPAPTLVKPDDEIGVGGSVLRVLPSGAGTAPAPPAKKRRPALRVVSGWAPGTHLPVDGTVVLGREAEGAAAFEGDPAVAAEHVRVSVAGERMLMIEDLGAPDGTLVGGVPIPAPTVLRVGDRFQIGGSTLEAMEAAGVARPEAAERDLERGGVREVPEGLLARIGMRAPVPREELLKTVALAVSCALVLQFAIRELAVGPLDVEDDLNPLEIRSLVLCSIAPIFNAIGFYKAFRRPDHTSMRRYVIPTLIVPMLFILINLSRTNHSGAKEVIVTLIVTLLPISLGATLMLRLRNRVARQRVASVAGG